MPFDESVTVLGGPDVAAWAETAFITRVEFQPGNFLVRHTKEGKRADSWPAPHVPGWGNGADDPGTIQWTLYVVIHNGQSWVTAPCILYHPQDVPTLGVHRGGGGAPFSDASRNWYYQVGGMAGRQPGPGQRIGVIAVAGAWRGVDVFSVPERSPICWVTVPNNDSGAFEFSPPAPPAPPAPAPAPEIPAPAPPAPLPAPTPAPGGQRDDRLLDALLAAGEGIGEAIAGLLKAARAIAAALAARR